MALSDAQFAQSLHDMLSAGQRRWISAGQRMAFATLHARISAKCGKPVTETEPFQRGCQLGKEEAYADVLSEIEAMKKDLAK